MTEPETLTESELDALSVTVRSIQKNGVSNLFGVDMQELREKLQRMSKAARAATSCAEADSQLG